MSTNPSRLGENFFERCLGREFACRNPRFKQPAARGVGETLVLRIVEVAEEPGVEIGREPEIMGRARRQRALLLGRFAGTEHAPTGMATERATKRLRHPFEPRPRRILSKALENTLGDRARFVQIPQRVIGVGEIDREHGAHIDADMSLRKPFAHGVEHAVVAADAVISTSETIGRDRPLARSARDKSHRISRAFHRCVLTSAMLGLRARVEIGEGKRA